MNNNVVELQGITKDFPYGKDKSFRALNNVDLILKKSEIYCLVGPSGSGKTTLLHILGLLDAASSGRYSFNGKDVSKLTNKELTNIRANQIAFMFQENYLIPYYTAYENVLFPILQLRKITKDDRHKAKELLVELGLEKAIHKRISNLSGGQRQRVCIARALVKSPDIIIADEPSASLDSKTTEGILEIFHKILDKEDSSIIVSTHDKTVIDILNNNVIEISDGGIIS